MFNCCWIGGTLKKYLQDILNITWAEESTYFSSLFCILSTVRYTKKSFKRTSDTKVNTDLSSFWLEYLGWLLYCIAPSQLVLYAFFHSLINSFFFSCVFSDRWHCLVPYVSSYYQGHLLSYYQMCSINEQKPCWKEISFL